MAIEFLDHVDELLSVLDFNIAEKVAKKVDY
jgi:hypothetical protein